MTTTDRPTLTPVLDRFKKPKMADAGATHQGDPIPMKECSACLGKVVWVKSIKTGKFYLADCFRYSGDGDNWYYVKATPHFKTCGTRAESKDTMTNELLRQGAIQRLMSTIDRTKDDWFEILDAGLDEIDRKYQN